MGLTKQQELMGWISQLKEYEERSWNIFRRMMAAKKGDPTFSLWGWEFSGINEEGVNFYYNNFGDTEHFSFDHDLLWDDALVEKELELIHQEKEAYKKSMGDLQRRQDLATLARLKEQYEN